VQGSINTARHIYGAKLEIFDGMGHDLPKALLPDFIDLTPSRKYTRLNQR